MPGSGAAEIRSETPPKLSFGVPSPAKNFTVSGAATFTMKGCETTSTPSGTYIEPFQTRLVLTIDGAAL